MKKTILSAAVILGVGLTACTKPDNSNKQKQKMEKTVTKNMENLISIVEIPANDFARAVKFYQAILGVAIEETEMDGIQMGLFPSDEKTVQVVLIKGAHFKPSTDGTTVYLNAGDNLAVILAKIKSNGGTVVVPKTQISPEMGFFAMFTDTEGNKLGLHAMH